MKIRLDKYLANMGLGSRKEVKDFISQGLVTVDGEVECTPKRIVDSESEVRIKDELLSYQEYSYYMLNKPKGFISATRDNRDTVLDLIAERDLRKGLFPVGRLDKDTTGLLLITNDGRLGHELLSPKKNVPKSYEATLDRPLVREDISAFRKGFFLEPEGILTKPAQLTILEDYRAKVTIVEGKYHQVKRMFSFCSKEVVELKRVSMGSLVLDPALEEGAYRPLTDEELQALRELVSKGPSPSEEGLS